MFFILLACAKEERVIIPYVPVDHKIDIINQLNLGVNESAIIRRVDDYTSRISYPNSSRPATIINGKTYGNGIIIFKEVDSYVAYDRTCTYRAVEDYCGLDYKQGSDFIFHCPCCNSEFDLVIGGYPVDSSRASAGLKRYNTTIYGNELIISN